MKITIGDSSFLGMLTILFIGLKVANVIAWPWVWVLSPLWIPAVLFLSIVGFMFFGSIALGAILVFLKGR